MLSSTELRRGATRPAFVAIGIFLFFGMTMAALSGTTLVWRGTKLDRIWTLNQRAHLQFAPMGPTIGLGLLLLALALGAAAVGWFQKKKWGWSLTVCIIAIQVVGDLVNLARGDYNSAGIGVVIAGALLIYLCRQPIRTLFI